MKYVVVNDNTGDAIVVDNYELAKEEVKRILNADWGDTDPEDIMVFEVLRELEVEKKFDLVEVKADD